MPCRQGELGNLEAGALETCHSTRFPSVDRVDRTLLRGVIFDPVFQNHGKYGVASICGTGLHFEISVTVAIDGSIMCNFLRLLRRIRSWNKALSGVGGCMWGFSLGAPSAIIDKKTDP